MSDTADTPRKRKRTRVEVEYDSKPPKSWESTWEKIQTYRNANLAPVDTMGCERLADTSTSKATFLWQTLVALMLSSQTKDPVTAQAVKNLQEFCKSRKQEFDVDGTLAMTDEELDGCISKVGFHNRKTQYIKRTALKIKQEHNGVTPRELEKVLEFEGVGPKMAYLFLSCTAEPGEETAGIGVDTHVHRISQRLGWVPKKVKNPEDTRLALQAWLPKEKWAPVNALLVGFGQTLCTPISPKCLECPVGKGSCPSYGRG